MCFLRGNASPSVFKSVVVLCHWSAPAGGTCTFMVCARLSVCGFTMGTSLFVYHQVNLLRCSTLHPRLTASPGTQRAVYCSVAAFLPPALNETRQGEYKFNRSLLLKRVCVWGGGQKGRKNKTTKREQQKGFSARIPWGTNVGFFMFQPVGVGNWTFSLKSLW